MSSRQPCACKKASQVSVHFPSLPLHPIAHRSSLRTPPWLPTTHKHTRIMAAQAVDNDNPLPAPAPKAKKAKLASPLFLHENREAGCVSVWEPVRQAYPPEARVGEAQQRETNLDRGALSLNAPALPQRRGYPGVPAPADKHPLARIYPDVRG